MQDLESSTGADPENFGVGECSLKWGGMLVNEKMLDPKKSVNKPFVKNVFNVHVRGVYSEPLAPVFTFLKRIFSG